MVIDYNHCAKGDRIDSIMKIHNHADQHQNEVVLSFDQSLLSSFSLFLLPISFHLNFEALVPRVVVVPLRVVKIDMILVQGDLRKFDEVNCC